LVESLSKDKLRAYGIGRFQVMALLQAARYYVLLGDLEKAKSFGINRAIFYAWAKYYGPAREGWYRVKIEELLRRGIKDEVKRTKCPEGFEEVLGECIQVSTKGYYKIGDKEQRPEDFDHQVMAKLRRFIDDNKLWEMAVNYVKQYPEWVLRDPRRFYKLVYEPIRDTFLVNIIEGKEPQPPKDIMIKLKAADKIYEESKKRQKSLADFIKR